MLCNRKAQDTYTASYESERLLSASGTFGRCRPASRDVTGNCYNGNWDLSTIATFYFQFCLTGQFLQNHASIGCIPKRKVNFWLSFWELLSQDLFHTRCPSCHLTNSVKKTEGWIEFWMNEHTADREKHNSYLTQSVNPQNLRVILTSIQLMWLTRFF